MITAFADAARPGARRRGSARGRVPELDGRPDHPGHHRCGPRAPARATYGIDDGWPVVCEPFAQWVLEDHFPLGTARFERVGVQLVEDVAPYELMKLRLLNAGHQAMCYLGYLAATATSHEVCADPLFTAFLLAYMDREATPTLEPVPGVDLDGYKHQLIERFANPEIKDTLARLVRRELGPDPQVAGAGDQAPARRRRRDHAVGARGRGLGALRRGRGRGRPRRSRSSTAVATRSWNGSPSGQRAAGLPRGPRPVRRPRRPAALHRGPTSRPWTPCTTRGARATLEAWRQPDRSSSASSVRQR